MKRRKPIRARSERREAFEAVGGFPDQPLMEDIELSRRLRRRGSPYGRW